MLCVTSLDPHTSLDLLLTEGETEAEKVKQLAKVNQPVNMVEPEYKPTQFDSSAGLLLSFPVLYCSLNIGVLLFKAVVIQLLSTSFKLSCCPFIASVTVLQSRFFLRERERGHK